MCLPYNQVKMKALFGFLELMLMPVLSLSVQVTTGPLKIWRPGQFSYPLPNNYFAFFAIQGADFPEGRQLSFTNDVYLVYARFLFFAYLKTPFDNLLIAYVFFLSPENVWGQRLLKD